MAEAAVALQAATEPTVGRVAESKWSLGHRIFFRFLFSYFVLYCLPDDGRVSVVNAIPKSDFLANKYIALWHAICPWVAIHIFHLSGEPVTYFPTGSGDTTLGYIQNLLFIVIALFVVLAWSLLDRKRPNYVTLDGWLRLLVRYTVAFTMFSYGFVKVFPLQFGTPGLLRLLEPYGDFSPMGALWWFMGASLPYIMFAGSMEVLGGLLLLFRRTTTLGALVAFGVMTNVCVLNYTYDVPVKLYSTNIVLMAAFLASPDFKRLLDFFVRNRATAPAEPVGPRFEGRRLRYATLAFWVLFVGYNLYSNIHQGWQGYQARYVSPKRSPIYGIYEVKTFVRNGQELPALVTDTTRWRKLVAQYPQAFSVKMMDDTVSTFGSSYDAATHTVSGNVDKVKKYQLTWSQPDADHLEMAGTIGNDAVMMKMQRIDPNNFLLLKRGFHWINERAFNR